jgi:hypothetical protein
MGLNWKQDNTWTYHPWDRHVLQGLKWCWWPKKCHASGRMLWLTRAYHTVRMIIGPGEPVFEHYWYSQQEFLLLQLKGTE